MEKYTFTILNEYLGITIEDINTRDLKIIENESDFSLGYITVEGENENIQYFKRFMNGEYQ
jgi:hypothetical protein